MSPNKRCLFPTPSRCQRQSTPEEVDRDGQKTPRRTPRKYSSKSAEAVSPPTGILRWSDEMDNCLIDTLMEEVANGKKCESGFKKDCYTPVVVNIRRTCRLIITTDHVKNRLRTIRKIYHTVRDMKNASGFGWDDELKLVVATDDVWEGWIRSHPYAKHVRGKPMPRYDDLEYCFGDDRATGANCMTGNFKTSGRHNGQPVSTTSKGHAMDLNDDTVVLSEDEYRESGPEIRWSYDSRGGVNGPQPSPAMNGNESLNGASTSNTRKRTKIIRPQEMMGTWMIDMAAAMKSIASTMKQGKDFARMSDIIPMLYELNGLSSQDILLATKLFSKEESYGAAFLNLPAEARLNFVVMSLNADKEQL